MLSSAAAPSELFYYTDIILVGLPLIDSKARNRVPVRDAYRPVSLPVAAAAKLRGILRALELRRGIRGRGLARSSWLTYYGHMYASLYTEPASR